MCDLDNDYSDAGLEHPLHDLGAPGPQAGKTARRLPVTKAKRVW
jgi:hypothetical protein